MLQKKQSVQDNSSSLKKKDKKRKHLDEGDQGEDKPQDHASGGQSGSNKPNKEVKARCQTPVHTDKKKAVEGIAPSLVQARFEQGECAHCGKDNQAWTLCRKSIVA